MQLPAWPQILAPGVNLVNVSPCYYTLQGGSFSRHGLVSFGATQYIAFYGVTTNVTVGRRTLGSTNWTLSATTFPPNSPTDGHNVISIGVSGDNYLHCSWGMHGNPFNYARGTAPGSLTLARTTMTGAENSVTYPQFIPMPNGDLLYLFREGGSGSGDTFLNRWSSTTHSWTNVNYDGGQRPFIEGTTGATDVNAYPNFTMVDAQTNLHLTWCWREDAATIESNHDQNYARSADYGRTWTKWNGTPYTLPITEATAEIIYPIGTNSTLINQAGMTLLTNGTPAICTWWAPGGAGTSIELMLVWRDATQWRTNQIGQRSSTTWPTRPIIVCDRTNNLFIAFCDPAHGGQPTLGWCSATNRALWNFSALTSDVLGSSWEPVHDPELWQRENKLHMLYKVGSTMPATMKVLEFDPAVFLANVGAATSSHTWTNVSGNWNTAVNWSSNTPPSIGGGDDLVLTFAGSSPYTSTNNLPGFFRLNRLVLNAAGAGTNRLQGNGLQFTNRSTVVPALEQSGAAAFQIPNAVQLGADLSVALTTVAPVALAGQLSGGGGVTVTGPGQLTLAANNTFTGMVALSQSTLSFGNGGLGVGGPLRAYSGGLRWLPGAADNIAAGREVRLLGEVQFDPNGNTVSLSGSSAGTGGIGGAGGLTLNDTNGGALILAQASTYSGATKVNAGLLIAAADAALGSIVGDAVVAGGTATSSLGIQGTISLAEPIRCGARQPLPNASALAAHVNNLSGTNVLTGNLTAETGGNQYNIESDGGLLVLAGNYSQTAGTGPRFLNLQGDAAGDWTGAITDGTAVVNVTKRGSGRWTLSGTNTYTGPTTISEGMLLVGGAIGSGAVVVNGTGTLGGSGLIRGATTVASGGQLAPGAGGLGTLTISNQLALASGSVTRLEIDGTTLAGDQVNGLTNLLCGGTLVVTNLGGDAALTNGARFRLFASAAYQPSTFAATSLPPLVPSLVWNTSFLGIDGTLRIEPAFLTEPRITEVRFSGSAQLVLQGTNGTPGVGYTVLVSSNVAAPRSEWITNAMGVFSASGTFSNAIPPNPAWPRAFYLVRVP